jgi:hypothetical protein
MIRPTTNGEATMNQPGSSLSRRRKAGHVLGIVLGVAHVSVLGVPSDGEDAGPPLPVLVVGAAIGLAVIILLVQSWRHDSGTARRVAGGLLVLAALGALPGLLVADVGLALRLAAGALIGLTVAAVTLLVSPQSSPTRMEVAR